MRVRPGAFAVHQCTAHDAGRYSINAVRVEADGTAVGTDGRCLLAVGTVGAVVSEDKPALVDADVAAKAIGKAGSVIDVKPDEVTVDRARHGFDPIDGAYPQWREMFDHEDAEDTTLVGTFSAEVLKRVFAAIEKAFVAGRGRDNNPSSCVTLRLMKRGTLQIAVVDDEKDARAIRLAAIVAPIIAKDEDVARNTTAWTKEQLAAETTVAPKVVKRKRAEE
jgi:hypothetical protein